MAMGFKARAHAALNEPEAFRRSIENAQRCLALSSPDEITPGIFSFLPAKLAFYEETGAVLLGDAGGAIDAAKRALALYDFSETTEPTLVKFEHASALVQDGEITEGCHIAREAILDSKANHGITVGQYAQKFDGLVRGIQSPATREWREAHAETHG
jgi:hypothetical protein